MKQKGKCQLTLICTSILMISSLLFSSLGNALKIEDELKLALKHEALERAVRESIGFLEKRMRSKETITEIISRNSIQHRKNATSLKLILTDEKKYLENDVQKQIRLIAKHGDYGLTKKQIENFIFEQSDPLNEIVDSLLHSQEFLTRFRAARSTAVKKQEAVLKRVLFPAASDIAALVGKYSSYTEGNRPNVLEIQKDKNSEIIRMSNKYAGDATVKYNLFEEIELQLIEKLTKEIKNGIDQYWHEHMNVEKSLGGREIEQNAIIKEINDELKKLRTQEENKEKYIYGRFDSVENHIDRRAKELERKKLEIYLYGETEKQCLDRPIARAVIRVSILNFRDVPTKINKHEQNLEKNNRKAEIELVLSARTRLVNAAVHREAFRGRMNLMLTTRGEIETLFQKLLNHCVKGTKGTPNHLKTIRNNLAKNELEESKLPLANYTYEFEMDDLISFRTKEFLTHYAGELASDEGLRLEETIKLFGSRKRELIEEAKAVINQLFGIVDRDDIKKRYQKLISDKLRPEINRKKNEEFEVVERNLSEQFNPMDKKIYARVSDVTKIMFKQVDWESIKRRIFEKNAAGDSPLDRMVTEYHKEVILAWKGQADFSVGVYQKKLHDKSRANKPKKYIHIVDNPEIEKVIRENITNQVYPVIAKEKEKWGKELEKKVEKAHDKAVIKRKKIQAEINRKNKLEASKNSTDKKNKTGDEDNDGKKSRANNPDNSGAILHNSNVGNNKKLGKGDCSCKDEKKTIEICRVANEYCIAAIICLTKNTEKYLCKEIVASCKRESGKCSSEK